MSTMNILVTGATGQQGGSVVEALLGQGHRVRGLTRDTASGRAKALQDRGVTLVKGDFHDTGALAEALKGMHAVFVVGTPFEAGTDDETKQGINAVDAAKKAGIKHLVYSSVSDADRDTGIPHFDSKYKVERHLESSGLTYTIIAPVFFYDNMTAPFVLPGLQNGTLAQALPAVTPLQSVSVRNIGQMVALAFKERDKFAGRRINIAGDSLTGPQYAQALSHASGRPITYVEVPLQKVREMSEDMAAMYDWFATVGYSADIAGLKSQYPEVAWESFSQWAERQDWSILTALKAS